MRGGRCLINDRIFDAPHFAVVGGRRRKRRGGTFGSPKFMHSKADVPLLTLPQPPLSSPLKPLAVK